MGWPGGWRGYPGGMAEPRRRSACPRCAGRGHDIRGMLALLGVLLTFGLAFAQLLLGSEDGATIPPWAAAFLTLVTQGYFMTKGAERHAEALRRGDAAAAGQPRGSAQATSVDP